MPTYAIGDIQGCYDSLMRLLESIQFSPRHDKLWLVGDLINRGPASLATLRLLYSLRNSCHITLGNHDLHFLVCHYLGKKGNPHDTFQDLLTAEDCPKLAKWLCQQPLYFYDKNINMAMVHAGLPPMWNSAQAIDFSLEIEKILQGDSAGRMQLLENLYGNHPAIWSEDLTGITRHRYIINAMTRLRFCRQNGELDMLNKTAVHSKDSGFLPWFQHSQRLHKKTPLFFGHWAALEGKVKVKNVIALDTGCVWGGMLSAYCLETKYWVRVR